MNELVKFSSSLKWSSSSTSW